MPITAKILADSVSPCGKRLVSYETTYPRAIHSEIMTHCALTKSSASSRAIPVAKLIERVQNGPWIPSYIGANQKGMQAGEELPEAVRAQAVSTWLYARDAAVKHAALLADMNVSKQVVNRLLEPWMFITVIITGTDWNNFFALRDHPSAEPHFQELARKMRIAREESTPAELPAGGWHLPLIPRWVDDPRCPGVEDFSVVGEMTPLTMVKIAVGRCARVSYLTHDGRRDIKEDIALHDRLLAQKPPHAAPFAHVAMALDKPERHGNLTGWKSYRMTLPNESVPG